MRFSELFMYAMRMMVIRSVAETPSVRKANHYEFMFGYNYGWMLLIFALTAAYAVVCPLITPFGLFYLIMKHAVDRYNLYFAYKPSKISKNIHATAVNCVIISLLIQQLVLLFFNIVRSQDSSTRILSPRAIFSLTMLVIFTLLFLAQIFFHVFKGISPLQYVQRPNNSAYSSNEHSDNSNNAEDMEELHQSSSADQRARRRKRNQHQFVPEVLRRDNFSAATSSSSAQLAVNGGDLTGLTTFSNSTRQPMAYGSTTNYSQSQDDDDNA